jgi:4a-hydroxytetrahydrobiopterin dehydratase
VPPEIEKVLDSVELADALIALPGWELKGKQIVKTFVFKKFAEAMEFVNAVAEAAEKMNHHPDIHINFTKVKIHTWTHKYNGVTKLDVKTAEKVDALYESA